MRSSNLTQNLVHYLGALVVTALTTLLLYSLQSYLNTSTIALVFLLPVLVSTTLWGLGPGLVSGFLAFLSLNYFFLPPYHTLLVHQTQDLIALLIFFGVAVTISQLVGRAQRSLAEARAREREASRLYELSLGLAGVSEAREIGGILEAHTLETFQAAHVEIWIAPAANQEAFVVSSAASPKDIDLHKPDALIPLQTSRGLLGEIRTWRPGSPLSPVELHMLRAFAAQGALSIERAALLQDLTRARVLEESDRMKTALLSSVSHELRTPLATIKAAATSLISGEVDWDSAASYAARQDLLAVIDEETDHLNRLVGNLLDMSRIEAGALNPNLQWNLLSEIVESAARGIHRALADYRLELDLPDDLPLVPLDFMQMERVFANLLSNSAKYAPPGSLIEISARPRQDQMLFVQVINQGPPVPENHLERIFDKFYRITDAERITGTGLGLSISKGIVEAHGGQIWAENLPGRFAFNLLLPLTWQGKTPAVVVTEAE